MAPKKKLPKTDGPPTELEFEKALMFFHAYMYGPLQGKLRLYASRSVRSPGAAASSDWEVFASILVNDVGKKLAAGVDLSRHEVKSAADVASQEPPIVSLRPLRRKNNSLFRANFFRA